MEIRRFEQNPIIRPNMDERMGQNINGPSLIRVPEWVENPLGRYYLYFAHHLGTYIRLAYADRLEGPWSIYSPGALDLSDSFFEGHVASPDVHIDDERKEFCLYYHGPNPEGQWTRVATSRDGLNYTAREEILGRAYFRMFRWDGWYYAMAMPGIFYRSKDGLSNYVQGPTLFGDVNIPPRRVRHFAFKLDGDVLSVFYSCVDDTPERILMSTIHLTPDWEAWTASKAVEVIAPETEYEGIDKPLITSVSGWAPERVRQLRDPAIYREDGKTYLLYSIAGEHGIAIAELVD